MNAQARRAATIEEKFELTAAGQGLALVPRTVTRAYSRPDVTYRRDSDILPVESCLAVQADEDDPLVLEFLGVAASILTPGGRTAGVRDT